MKSITFLRHAESFGNVDLNREEKDPGLTERGKESVKNLYGMYDLVICSVMKRARETLEYSDIKYNEIIYDENCREVKNHNRDLLEDEKFDKPESVESFVERIKNFKIKLDTWIQKYDNVLIVSHLGFIGNFIKIIWGKEACLRNAEMIQLNFNT